MKIVMLLAAVLLAGCVSTQAPRAPETFTCVLLPDYPGERGNDGKWSYRYKCGGQGHQMIKFG